jgi:hypothetical protein
MALFFKIVLSFSFLQLFYRQISLFLFAGLKLTANKIALSSGLLKCVIPSA